MPTPYEREIMAWRVHRTARLTAPDGWLAVVGLAWLAEGENTVGSDPSCRVRLPGDDVPGVVGSIILRGDAATFTARPGSGVTHQGLAVAELPLRDDLAGEPTRLRVGSVVFHLIRRYDRLAVRIRDEESPARAAFKGIDYFPIDRRWRVQARFEPHQPSRVSRVPTVLDKEETYDTPGAVAFEVKGVSCRLEAFLEPGETDLFIVFGDQTNGSETYGGGRYLYTRQADASGLVIVDFNKAYNPPCVFTPHATCALPLPENRLPVRVEAGEKRYSSM